MMTIEPFGCLVHPKGCEGKEQAGAPPSWDYLWNFPFLVVRSCSAGQASGHPVAVFGGDNPVVVEPVVGSFAGLRRAGAA
jgi:hypothetical protein